MRLRRPDPHTLAGAYAIDAVHEADRARFDRHLARCEACAEEIAGLRETTAILGASGLARPPAVLKERVLAAAVRVRQLPPSSREPASLWPAGYASSGGRPQRTWTRRLAPVVASSFAAVAITLGGVALATQHRLGQVQAEAQARSLAIAGVLNAPDTTMLTSHVTAGGTATIVMSRRLRALVFTTKSLPELPAAKCYELFLMRPTGDRPAGMLPDPQEGMTAPIVTTGLTETDKLGLTVEPAGGSQRPTSTLILLLTLPS